MGVTMTGKGDREPAGYPDLAMAIADHVAPAAVREDLEQLFRRLAFNVLAASIALWMASRYGHDEQAATTTADPLPAFAKASAGQAPVPC